MTPRRFRMLARTVAKDTKPNAFSFDAIANADLSSAYESNEVAVSGINAPTIVTVLGGLVSINGGAYGLGGLVSNGGLVKAKLTSSANYETIASAIVTIGGVSAAFTVETRTEAAAAMPNVAPAETWAGTATLTGVPAVEERTVAKPGARMLTVAHDNGVGAVVVSSLDEIAGIHGFAADDAAAPIAPDELVCRVFCEGNSYTVPWSSHVHTDANGDERTLWGWFVRIDHSAFPMDGYFNLTWEIDPTAVDPTQQKRRLGPFLYYRGSAGGLATGGHQHEVTVAPSQAAIAGMRYKTLLEAMAYVIAQSSINPKITIAESGEYVIAGDAGNSLGGPGFLTITHAPGVTATLRGDGANQVGYYGVWLRGAGIQIDQGLDPAGLSWRTLASTSNNRGLVLDGIRIFNSFGRDSKEANRASAPFNSNFGDVFILDGTIFEETNSGPTFIANSKDMRLIRNVTCRKINGDAIRGTNVFGFRVIDHDNSYLLSPAKCQVFTLTYTGGAATATYETSNPPGGTANKLILKEAGVTVATIPLYNAGPLTLQSIVDAVNARAGWTATFQAEHLDAHYLTDGSGRATGNTAVPSTSCKGVTRQLYAMNGNHADSFQPVTASATDVEAALFVNVDIQTVAVGTEDGVQQLLLKDRPRYLDTFFVNYAAGGNSASLGQVLLAQLVQTAAAGETAFQNVHFWNCAFLDQSFDIKGNTDARSSVRNSIIRRLITEAGWTYGLKFDSNYVGATSLAVAVELGRPKNDGATLDSLVSGQSLGDFAPLAALETATSIVRFDGAGAPRPALSRIGARA